MTSLTDTQVVTASGGLVELGYSERTSSYTLPSASSSYADPFCPEITVVSDGSPLLIEFQSPASSVASGGSIYINLVIDGSITGIIYQSIDSTSQQNVGIRASRRVSLSAGSHTIAVSAWGSGLPSPSIQAGNGGIGSFHPMFLRVSKIVQATQWPAVTTGTIICTSSTRPASPFEGQTIYETDTKKQLTYDGAGWYPPWNQPWGLVAKAELSANTSGITTGSDLATGDLTFTAVAGRAYRIYSQVLITIGVADAYFGLQIKEGSTIHTTGISTVIQNTGLATLYASRVMTFSAGSHSLKMHVYRQLGAGNAATAISPSNRPDYLMVEDIGPA
jgi:hypothetical protein